MLNAELDPPCSDLNPVNYVEIHPAARIVLVIPALVASIQWWSG
jgi:hypothetical protein